MAMGAEVNGNLVHVEDNLVAGDKLTASIEPARLEEPEIIVNNYYNFLQKINKYIDFFGLISIVILFYSENKPEIEFNDSFKIIEILKQSTDFVEKNFKFKDNYYVLPPIYFLANNKIYETLNVKNYENHKLLIFFEKLKKDKLI